MESSSRISSLLVQDCFSTGLANGEATSCLFRAAREREREREERKTVMTLRANSKRKCFRELTSSVGRGCTSCFPAGSSVGNFDPRRCCRCGVVAMAMKEWRLLMQHVGWHWADSHTTDWGQAREGLKKIRTIN